MHSAPSFPITSKSAVYCKDPQTGNCRQCVTDVIYAKEKTLCATQRLTFNKKSCPCIRIAHLYILIRHLRYIYIHFVMFLLYIQCFNWPPTNPIALVKRTSTADYFILIFYDKAYFIWCFIKIHFNLTFYYVIIHILQIIKLRLWWAIDLASLRR